MSTIKDTESSGSSPLEEQRRFIADCIQSMRSREAKRLYAAQNWPELKQCLRRLAQRDTTLLQYWTLDNDNIRAANALYMATV